jgi:hypothetical protein
VGLFSAKIAKICKITAQAKTFLPVVDNPLNDSSLNKIDCVKIRNRLFALR